MGVREIVCPENAHQRTGHLGASKDQLQLRQTGNNVVARVELVFLNPIKLLIDGLVKFLREAWTQNDIAVGDVFAHLLIVEKNGHRRFKLHIFNPPGISPALPH